VVRAYSELSWVLPEVEVPAVCDINEANLARAVALVQSAARLRPQGYSGGVEDFRNLALREDLDAVITATPWNGTLRLQSPP
jgi:hypothetical protein